jgi:hypothetical protein
MEALLRHKPCRRITISGALDTGEAITTIAMKMIILENIRTANRFDRVQSSAQNPGIDPLRVSPVCQCVLSRLPFLN